MCINSIYNEKYLKCFDDIINNKNKVVKIFIYLYIIKRRLS